MAGRGVTTLRTRRTSRYGHSGAGLPGAAGKLAWRDDGRRQAGGASSTHGGVPARGLPFARCKQKAALPTRLLGVNYAQKTRHGGAAGVLCAAATAGFSSGKRRQRATASRAGERASAAAAVPADATMPPLLLALENAAAPGAAAKTNAIRLPTTSPGVVWKASCLLPFISLRQLELP